MVGLLDVLDLNEGGSALFPGNPVTLPKCSMLAQTEMSVSWHARPSAYRTNISLETHLSGVTQLDQLSVGSGPRLGLQHVHDTFWPSAR